MSVHNKNTNPTTIGYKYLFTYQGDVKFKEHTVKGVCITLALKLYKYGRIIPISLEPMYNGHFLNEIFNVSINKFCIISIEKNKFMERIFKNMMGFEDAAYEIIEYSIEILKEKNIEEEIETQGAQTLPAIETHTINEDEFNCFIAQDMENFLLKENKKAKVENALLVKLEEVS